MSDKQVHMASIQIPDVAYLNHRVSLIYKQIQYSPDITYLIEKFYTVIFFNQLTVDQHRVNISNDQYLLDLFTADGVDSVPVHYINFIRELFDALSDKIEALTTQAHTLKTILTGAPNISGIQFEKHATGWYIVLY